MKLIITILITSTLFCLADGKSLYEKHCAKCHGLDGKGQTKMGQKLNAKDYTDVKVQTDLKDTAAIKAVKDGFVDKEGKILMKPSDELSDTETKSVIAYMRTFKK